MTQKGKPAQARSINEESVASTLRKLDGVATELRKSHECIAKKLQAVLHELAGVSFPSHEKAAATTRLVQELMQHLGKRAKCPNTGEACNLRCTQAGRRTKISTFQFERFLAGKRTVTAAFTVFPDVQLIEAPPDRRREKSRG